MPITAITFHCRRCRVALCRPVQLAPRSALNIDGGGPWLPDDKYAVGDGENGFDSGLFVVPENSAINWKDHPDNSRFTGCCGPVANMMLKNRLCVNGHEIGCVQTECFLPHGMAFDSVSVYRSDDGGPEIKTVAPKKLAELANSITSIRSFAESLAVAEQLEGLYALADLLQEEGCQDWPVLNHLRQGSTHHGGCLVLDWLLGV